MFDHSDFYWIVVMCSRTTPYFVPEPTMSSLKPRIKAYSGWSSYKNVKSGNYNRQSCGQCLGFKGFPQTPGVYDLDIVDTPPRVNNSNNRNIDLRYQIYQAERMSNGIHGCNSGYRNYLDEQRYNLYPQRYVKGNWPDERLIYTNTPVQKN